MRPPLTPVNLLKLSLLPPTLTSELPFWNCFVKPHITFCGIFLVGFSKTHPTHSSLNAHVHISFKRVHISCNSHTRFLAFSHFDFFIRGPSRSLLLLPPPLPPAPPPELQNSTGSGSGSGPGCGCVCGCGCGCGRGCGCRGRCGLDGDGGGGGHVGWCWHGHGHVWGLAGGGDGGGVRLYGYEWERV